MCRDKGLTAVWVEQEDCGDYYCGCGGGHIVAVYDTPHEGCVRVELNEKRSPTYTQKPNGDWSRDSWT